MNDDETKNCIFCGSDVDLADPLAGFEIRTQCIYNGVLGNIIQKKPGKKIFMHTTCEVPKSLAHAVANDSLTDCKHCKMSPLFHQPGTLACPVFSGSRWFFDDSRQYSRPNH